MIDNVCILLSLGAIVFVLMRAVVLDKTRPWFSAPKPATPPTGNPQPGLAKPGTNRVLR